MHFRSTKESSSSLENFNKKSRIAIMCSEQFSLSIYNVRLRDQLEMKSFHDSLTGLKNRRSFDETSKGILLKANKDKRRINALVSLDIDYFKSFNDTYGHDAGDAVLIFVAHSLDLIMIDDNAAFFPDDGATVSQLLKNSDITLYEAKELGRNKVIIYSAEE